jgi:hypothetical protein
VVPNCRVDGVDNERSPRDDERGDNEEQGDCNVSLLSVQFVGIHRGAVEHSFTVRPYRQPDSDRTHHDDHDGHRVARDYRQYEVRVGSRAVRVLRGALCCVGHVVGVLQFTVQGSKKSRPYNWRMKVG